MKAKMKAAIIGAGITGMRIAAYLAEAGYEVTVLEKTGKLGGMTSSFKYKDFTLDYGPHKFYTQIPGVYDDFKKIVGEGNYLVVKKKNSIRLQGKYFDFPVKLTQLLLQIKPTLAYKIFIDFVKAQLTRKEVISYEDYFKKGFGKTGYDILFRGFAEKVWGNPANLSEELARRRSPAKNIVDVLKTAIIKGDKNTSAEHFYYPKEGYGVMCVSLAKKLTSLKGKILFETKIKKISVKKNKVEGIEFLDKSGKKKKLKCDILVSTSALNELVQLISPAAPAEVLSSLEDIKFRSLIIAFVLLDKDKVLEDNWIFFPEREFCFNRVAEQKSFSPLTGPKGQSVITAEITCDFGDELYNSSEEKIKEMVIKDLEKGNLIKRDQVKDFFTRKAGRVYPVYSLGYKKKLNISLDWMDKISNLYTVGRLGLFNYNNADHCLDMAKVTSDVIINSMPRESWKKARDYFDTYRIVD